MSFRELENDTTRLYEDGRYRAALDRLDAESDNFPALGHRCKIGFFRACLLAKDADPDAALEVLETALDQGLWWSESMLADHDLDSCRGERLDRIIQRADHSVDSPLVFVDHGLPGGGVLLALHGGGEVVASDDNPWAPALDAGWTVYRPVSTQRLGAGLATWSNLDVAVEECRAHLADIGSIDAIGSFSLGGSLALRLITEVVSVPALMIAPSLRAPAVVAAAPNAGGAVIDVITGEHDPFLELTIAGVAQLRTAGADVRVDVLAGVAHDFPHDFAQRLPGRLDGYFRRRT